jgi:branched-chain amino acid aminotransferase
MLASLDGAVLPAEEARIPITDEGLLRGDGVFEVVRLYGGRPFALDEHLERMAGSAERARLPLDAALLRAEAEALLAAGPSQDGVMRLLVTRGGRRIAILEELRSFPPTIALATITYAPTRVLDQVKSLSYAANMLCTRLATEQGADEALLVTPHGRVLEAPTSSFFYVRDGRLRTPPLTDHILDSITRRRVLAVADVEEVPTTLDAVREADEAFLASTLKEALPVHAIDDHTLTAPGPVSLEVAAALAARIAAEMGDG